MFGFGKALDVLRMGDAVRRDDWQEDAFLVMVPGSVIEVAADRPIGKAVPRLVGELVSYSWHIDIVTMYNSGSSVLVQPWQPSQEAVLAEDWDYVR